MRGFIKLIAVLYLAGIVVVLASAIRDNWQNAPSVLYTNVVRGLPDAFAWPVNAFRALLARSRFD
jgi:hypothetical protein